MMNEEPNQLDELNELLSPSPTQETPGLRDAIFRNTHRRLAFSRWSRRAGKIAGIAAVFMAGLGVGVWRTSRERETVFVTVPETQKEFVAVPVLFPVPDHSNEIRPPTTTHTAHSLELDAEQTDDTAIAAKLYRQAGDAYLNAEQDYANAARCYRLFLARGGDTALSPEPNDSWLLTSLKNAIFKEKVHATSLRG